MHPKTKTKNIVILGAGFCGIAAAQNLIKKIHHYSEYQIYLIDKQDRHAYFADLYEVGTAYSPHLNRACVHDLSDTVSIPISNIFVNTSLKFLQRQVQRIDHQKQKIIFENGQSLSYQYLVLSLGSVVNFFGIPGLDKHAFTLKSIKDALRIDCHLDHYFEAKKTTGMPPRLNIAIGGGGFAGVEFAAELHGYLQKLGLKYRFSARRIQVTIIEALPRLLNISEKISALISARLQKLGIRICLKSRIIKYDGRNLYFRDYQNKLQKIATEIVVWTGGIAPNPILKKSFSRLSSKNEIEVKSTLSTIYYRNIYAGGDNALIIDPRTDQPVPKVAQLALTQGKIIAKNIMADILGRPKAIYQPRFKGFIIPLGGKYYIYFKGRLILKGFIPFLMRRILDLKYFLKVLPFKTALQKWYRASNLFAKND